MEGLFGLAGVIVGAVLQWAHLTWSEWRERSRNARYLAIRVVCVLDKYIEDCLSVTFDDGFNDGGGEDGTAETTVKVPSAPLFPEDVDWKSIDTALMYRLLAFPRDIEVANHEIRAAGEFASPPDYEEFFEARQLNYAKLGITAAEIAKDIRKEYKIPTSRQEKDEWYAPTQLQKQLKKIEDASKKRQVEQERMSREFFEGLETAKPAK